MKYGKVIKYDNYVGNIIDNDGIIYIFTNDDLKESININDYVMFLPEVYETVEIKEFRARFIKRYVKEN